MGLGKLLKKVADPLGLHKKTKKLVAKTDPVAKKLMGTRVGKATKTSLSQGMSTGGNNKPSSGAKTMQTRMSAAATPRKPVSSGFGRSLVNERRRIK